MFLKVTCRTVGRIYSVSCCCICLLVKLIGSQMTQSAGKDIPRAPSSPRKQEQTNHALRSLQKRRRESRTPKAKDVLPSSPVPAPQALISLAHSLLNNNLVPQFYEIVVSVPRTPHEATLISTSWRCCGPLTNHRSKIRPNEPTRTLACSRANKRPISASRLTQFSHGHLAYSCAAPF
jgi:hypothetical protein